MEPLSRADEILNIHVAMAIASTCVGLVFAYAATSKLLDLPGFIAGIRAYDAVPGQFAPLAGALLIIGEGVIAWTHVTQSALPTVVPGVIIVLFVFLAVIINLIRRGDRKPCLCFGAARDEHVDIYSVIRVLLLLLIEASLFSYLLLYKGSMDLGAQGAFGSINLVLVGVSMSVVTLISWVLGLPRILRVWQVVNS